MNELPRIVFTDNRKPCVGVCCLIYSDFPVVHWVHLAILLHSIHDEGLNGYIIHLFCMLMCKADGYNVIDEWISDFMGRGDIKEISSPNCLENGREMCCASEATKCIWLLFNKVCTDVLIILDGNSEKKLRVIGIMVKSNETISPWNFISHIWCWF